MNVIVCKFQNFTISTIHVKTLGKIKNLKIRRKKYKYI